MSFHGCRLYIFRLCGLLEGRPSRTPDVHKVETIVRWGKYEINAFKSGPGFKIDVFLQFPWAFFHSASSCAFWSIRLDKNFRPEDVGSYLSGSSTIRCVHLFHIFKCVVLSKCGVVFCIWLYLIKSTITEPLCALQGQTSLNLELIASAWQHYYFFYTRRGFERIALLFLPMFDPGLGLTAASMTSH